MCDDPLPLDAVPTAATLDELAAHVHARTPAVYHIAGATEEEWRSQLEQHAGSHAFPVRLLGARRDAEAGAEAPYVALARYLWASFKTSVVQRRMTLAEAARVAPRWMVSGVDQRLEGSLAPAPGQLMPLDALDELMPADARTTATGCWISSAGCATGLHWDSFGPHNFHLQVCGSKRFVLYENAQAPNLYCYGGFKYLLRFAAAVDFERPDLRRFPRFASARGMEVVLRAGDVLFIPAYYWHAASHLAPFNGSYTRWFEEPPATHPSEPPVPWSVHLNLVRFLVLDPLLDLIRLLAAVLLGAGKNSRKRTQL